MKILFPILTEPAGWFFFWEGLNLTLFEPKRIKPDLEFYRKPSVDLLGENQ